MADVSEVELVHHVANHQRPPEAHDARPMIRHPDEVLNTSALSLGGRKRKSSGATNQLHKTSQKKLKHGSSLMHSTATGPEESLNEMQHLQNMQSLQNLHNMQGMQGMHHPVMGMGGMHSNVAYPVAVLHHTPMAIAVVETATVGDGTASGSGGGMHHLGAAQQPLARGGAPPGSSSQPSASSSHALVDLPHDPLSPTGDTDFSEDEHDGAGVGDSDDKKLQSKTLKKGKFSKREREILRKRVDQYIEDHSLGADGMSLLCAKQRQANLRGAWAEIARCLPGRTISAVYHFCTRAFAAKHTGKWMPEEIDRLKELVNIHGRSWSRIGAMLNRLPCSCRDKYRLVERVYKQGKWTAEEDKKLVELVSELCPGEKPPREGILWTTISQRMGNRSHSACRNRWYNVIYGTLTRATHWQTEDDLQLVNSIVATGAEDESEVNWSTISTRMTTTPAHYRWKQLCKRYGDNHNLSFSAVARKLQEDLAQIVLGNGDNNSVPDNTQLASSSGANISGGLDEKHEMSMHHSLPLSMMPSQSNHHSSQYVYSPQLSTSNGMEHAYVSHSSECDNLSYPTSPLRRKKEINKDSNSS